MPIDYDTTLPGVVWRNGQKLATLLETTGGEVVFDDVGVASGTLVYQCMYANSVALVASFTRHPSFAFLKRKNARIVREEAGMARVTINFEGIPTGEENENRKTYTLHGGTGTEPIESHTQFGTFAGKWNDPATWVNGARFATQGEDRGKFLGFVAAQGDDDPNPKAGVQSYYAPTLVYSEVELRSKANSSSIAVNMNNLGKIDTPPNSDVLPQVSSGRDWLLTDCTVEEVGDGVRITRRWRLSGRNGWDPDIYGD